MKIMGMIILRMSNRTLTNQYAVRLMPEITCICLRLFSLSFIIAPTIRPGRRLSPTAVTKSNYITEVSFS